MENILNNIALFVSYFCCCCCSLFYKWWRYPFVRYVCACYATNLIPRYYMAVAVFFCYSSFARLLNTIRMNASIQLLPSSYLYNKCNTIGTQTEKRRQWKQMGRTQQEKIQEKNDRKKSRRAENEADTRSIKSGDYYLFFCSFPFSLSLFALIMLYYSYYSLVCVLFSILLLYIFIHVLFRHTSFFRPAQVFTHQFVEFLIVFGEKFS